LPMGGFVSWSSGVAQAPPPPGSTGSQAAPPPGPSRAAAWSNATRYLCTAAHADEGFARVALEDILYAPYRAVAPSPGYDLGVLLRHCWAARALADRTAATAVALAAVASLLGSIPVAVALGFSALFALVGWVRQAKLLRAALGFAVLPVLVVAAVVALPFAAAAAVVLACGLGTYLWAFSRMRSRHAPLGGQTQLTARLGSRLGAAVAAWVVSAAAAVLLAGALVGLLPWEARHPEVQLVGLAALVGCWVVLVQRRLAVQRNIVALHADTWDPAGAPAVPADLEGLLARLEARDRDGNVTFFEGNDPFFAHGTFVEGWTVPITLRPDPDDAADGRDPAGTETYAPAGTGSLMVAEVVDAIRRKLLALDVASLPLPLRMPGLRVRDRCYASGTLVGPDPQWLPDPAGPPVADVPDWLVAAVRDDAAGIARHYLCLEVGGWSEDLVVTVPVHASLVGGLLYLEFWAFVLPPIRPEYRQCDWRLPTSGVFDAVASVSVRWAGEMAAAVRTLLRVAGDTRRRWANADEVATAVRYHRPVAHGAQISLRRRAARTVPSGGTRPDKETSGESYAGRIAGYDQLFQYSDVQRICRVAEKQVLDAVLDLLTAKGLDVGEFRAFRGSRISVTNVGGTMTIGSVGERSRGAAWGGPPPASVPGSQGGTA